MAYDSNTIGGLSLTTPTEDSSYIPELNDAIREIKRALQYQYTTKSITNTDSPYSTVDTSSIILCDATSGAITVDLDTDSVVDGRTFKIKKIDSSANAITITTEASETIDGAANTTLDNQYDSVCLVCDGSNWYIF